MEGDLLARGQYTWTAIEFDGVSAANSQYDAECNIDDEQRCIEDEHKARSEEAPERVRATKTVDWRLLEY